MTRTPDASIVSPRICRAHQPAQCAVATPTRVFGRVFGWVFGQVVRRAFGRVVGRVLGPAVMPVVMVAVLVAVMIMDTRAGSAQTEVRYVEQPTQGVALPGVALAGEHDAFSVSVNPAGLRFLRGFHAALAMSVMDQDRATSAGQGLGLYLGDRIGGGWFPTVGLGLGLELGRPSRSTLEPDPGTPARLTLATALPIGAHGALGISRHWFIDEDGATTHGLATWDLGLAMRLGAYVAMGGAIRDLSAPDANGQAVERRYELEFIGRPMATDRLELALGGRVAETSAHVDGWARVSARVLRGLYLHGEVEAREFGVVTTSPTGTTESNEREYLARVGLSVSFGGFGTSLWGAGVRDPAGARRVSGGTVLLRASSERIPSVLGPGKRIERMTIESALSERELTSVVLRLRAMARDDGVVALVVAIDDLDLGWASVEELWNELTRVRQSGKKVYAYLLSASIRDYFLATAADRIYQDPAGGIRLQGLSATAVYFKGVFDKLGITAQFIKVDEYKSAPEAYTRETPTEPALRMRNELYDEMFNTVIQRIAERRGLDRAKVLELIDNGPYTAGDLANSPLVDAVALPDKISELVITDLGHLYRVAEAPLERPERWSLPAVAVIYIDGDIISGDSRTMPIIGRKLIGSDTIVKAIAKARADRGVKAIVLRINSPGGSAVASEMMAREVFKTRGVKPIICSMGDVAASGGYFAAAGCDVIFAQPTTITGSIGIFTGKFDVSGLLARVGLSWTVYKRGQRSDMESYFRPYSDDELALILEKISYLYGRFTRTVADGRGMSQDDVDKIARGRVWSGRAAKNVGLVDQFGGLADAIELAKQRAGLGADRRVRVLMLPTPQSSILDLVLGASGARQAQAPSSADSLLPGADRLFDAIPGSLWHQPDEAQARLPFHIEWR